MLLFHHLLLLAYEHLIMPDSIFRCSLLDLAPFPHHLEDLTHQVSGPTEIMASRLICSSTRRSST